MFCVTACKQRHKVLLQKKGAMLDTVTAASVEQAQLKVKELIPAAASLRATALQSCSEYVPNHPFVRYVKHTHLSRWSFGELGTLPNAIIIISPKPAKVHKLFVALAPSGSTSPKFYLLPLPPPQFSVQFAPETAQK